MATSKVQIANLALMHVGEKSITSFTDGSNAANTINQVYDVVRDAVLTDHPWNFAVKRVIPSLDATAPVYGFTYRFDLPTDYLRLLEIDENPEYKISGLFIECDVNPIKIKYIAKNDTAIEYDPLFVQALALRLSSTICERLTQSSTLSKELFENYLKAISAAKSVDAQSDYPDNIEADLWLDSRLKGTSSGSGDL